MIDHDTVLQELYRRIDSDAPGRAVELLADSVLWEFSLPDRTVGGGRDEFAAFVRDRPPAAARHRLTVVAHEGTQDVAAGWLEPEGTAPSAFVATAMRNDVGLITALLLRRTGLSLPV